MIHHNNCIHFYINHYSLLVKLKKPKNYHLWLFFKLFEEENYQNYSLSTFFSHSHELNEEKSRKPNEDRPNIIYIYIY